MVTSLQPCSLAAGTPGTFQKLVKGISCSASSSTLTITRPDDWHLHLRDGAGLKSVVPHTAQHFSRAVIMPNLVPPVTSSKQVYTRRQRQCNVTLLSAACRKSREAEPLDDLTTGQQINLQLCTDTSYTLLQALEYKQRILEATPSKADFKPPMPC